MPSRGTVKPIVSYSSARYEHAEDMVGFWAAALALTLTGFIFAQAWSAKPWPSAPAVWAWGPLPILVVIVIGFIAGTLLCSQLEPLRRLFVPKKAMAAAVAQRAKQLYHDNCRHDAAGDGPGKTSSVLIYVSVYEQMVEVIHGRPDCGSLDGQLGDIRKAILRSLKSANAPALQAAVLKACQTLEGNFASTSENCAAEKAA
jgi:uncharacterized membrane protein